MSCRCTLRASAGNPSGEYRRCRRRRERSTQLRLDLQNPLGNNASFKSDCIGGAQCFCTASDLGHDRWWKRWVEGFGLDRRMIQLATQPVFHDVVGQTRFRIGAFCLTCTAVVTEVMISGACLFVQPAASHSNAANQRRQVVHTYNISLSESHPIRAALQHAPPKCFSLLRGEMLTIDAGSVSSLDIAVLVQALCLQQLTGLGQLDRRIWPTANNELAARKNGSPSIKLNHLQNQTRDGAKRSSLFKWHA
jgi:hypothetical protein